MKTAPSSRQAWLVVTLLAVFMMINTADRAALGLAGPSIIQDLHLTNTEFGFVGSSFFFLYSLSAVGVGFLSNRVSTRSTLFLLVLVWSLAQAPLAWPVGLEMLIASRVVLGAGEGPGYPVALHGAYKWFADERRALPTAVIAQGATLGVVVILPVLNVILARYSWHAMFAALTFLGVLWSVLWLAVGREGPLDSDTKAATAERRPYRELIFDRRTIAVWIIGFGAFWGYSLLITWFPAYLAKGLAVRPESLGVLSALPWLVSTVVIVVVGALSQSLLRAGVSSRFARFHLGAICVLTGGLLMAGFPLAQASETKLAMLIGGISLPIVILSLIPPIIGEYVPASQRGAMLALGQAVVTSAGILAPAITGHLADVAGYELGFELCGLIVSGAALLGWLALSFTPRRGILAA